MFPTLSFLFPSWDFHYICGGTLRLCPFSSIIFSPLFFSFSNFYVSISKCTDSFVCHFKSAIQFSSQIFLFSLSTFPLQNLHLVFFIISLSVLKISSYWFIVVILYGKSMIFFSFFKRVYTYCFEVLTTKPHIWDLQRVSVACSCFCEYGSWLPAALYISSFFKHGHFRQYIVVNMDPASSSFPLEGCCVLFCLFSKLARIICFALSAVQYAVTNVFA